MITGKIRLLGVMGWPVGHSRSPQMQNAAVATAGLDYVYVPLAVPPERLRDAVRGLPALGFRGANVTIPHKVAVMEFMDELRPAAVAIGAVNTIIVEDDGRLIGDNTDCYGAVEALRESTGVSPAGKDVVVLGAGGASRAVVWGAAEAGARSVTIVNRTVEKAEVLAAEMRLRQPGTEFRVLANPRAEELAGARLFFQMTSLGMKPGDAMPLEPKLVPQEAVALEAIYSPLVTPWMAALRERGIAVADGLSMLVAQGARSFEAWTGVAPDRRVMRQALGIN